MKNIYSKQKLEDAYRKVQNDQGIILYAVPGMEDCYVTSIGPNNPHYVQKSAKHGWILGNKQDGTFVAYALFSSVIDDIIKAKDRVKQGYRIHSWAKVGLGFVQIYRSDQVRDDLVEIYVNGRLEDSFNIDPLAPDISQKIAESYWDIKQYDELQDGLDDFDKAVASIDEQINV